MVLGGWWSSSWNNSVARSSCQAGSKKSIFFAKKNQELSPFLRTKYFLKRVCAVFMLAACYLALTTELLHEELHHHQEPFTLILGFMLMLAKNPFRTIHKHPFALSVQKIIRNKKRMGKLWISVLSSAPYKYRQHYRSKKYSL